MAAGRGGERRKSYQPERAYDRLLGEGASGLIPARASRPDQGLVSGSETGSPAGVFAAATSIMIP